VSEANQILVGSVVVDGAGTEWSEAKRSTKPANSTLYNEFNPEHLP